MIIFIRYLIYWYVPKCLLDESDFLLCPRCPEHGQRLVGKLLRRGIMDCRAIFWENFSCRDTAVEL